MNLTQVVRNEVLKNASHVVLSGLTAYHLLSGSLALANTTIDTAFSTTLHTGNGTSQSVVTGIDMTTQWGSDATKKYGGMLEIKGRSGATSHYFTDTVRGVTKNISSDTNGAESTNATGLTSFNNNGFSIGALAGMNTNAATYVSWVHQTTHQFTGTTNHGQSYTCHYNPVSGFTILKYSGSGLTGHEIPHHLGRRLGLWDTKNLTTAATDWVTQYRDSNYLVHNTTAAEVSGGNICTDTSIILSSNDSRFNASSNNYIIYGWATSYFDKSNTLIGNYQIGLFQGTGASGNKIPLLNKPALVKIKRIDSTGRWVAKDNKRTSFQNSLYDNDIGSEDSWTTVTISTDSFTVGWSNGSAWDLELNASGGQYLYFVIYDNDNGSGKSKYPKPSDTTTINLTATVPLAQGIDSNGVKASILTKNETITGLTLTEGKNYIYLKADGTYGVKSVAPQYISYNGFGDYYSLNTNTWYNSPSIFSDTCDTTTNWTAGELSNGAAATISSVNGELKIVNTGATSGQARASFATVVGKKYKLVLNNTSYSGASPYVWVNIGTTLNGYDLQSGSGFTGKNSFNFIAGSTTTYISLTNSNTSGAISTWDDIAVYPINNDGSVDISGAVATTNSRNYLDAIVYADQNGKPTYIEQLSKTEYADIIQATEFKGKNACTAWVNFDGTTTPPTIRDSYNVKAVIRTATGVFDIYFDKPMDNTNYVTIPNSNIAVTNHTAGLINKVSIYTYSSAFTASNASNVELSILGGKI